MNTPKKNKLYTLGYFTKRLRDCNFIVLKIFNSYSSSDKRKWTILVDPGNTSTYITCVNDLNDKDVKFLIDDNGKCFPKNFYMKTDSIEIIVEKLLTNGVQQAGENNNYLKANEA